MIMTIMEVVVSRLLYVLEVSPLPSIFNRECMENYNTFLFVYSIVGVLATYECCTFG